MIELRIFHARDEKGKRIPAVAAHMYCFECGMNYSHYRVYDVEEKAAGHVVCGGYVVEYS